MQKKKGALGGGGWGDVLSVWITCAGQCRCSGNVILDWNWSLGLLGEEAYGDIVARVTVSSDNSAGSLFLFFFSTSKRVSSALFSSALLLSLDTFSGFGFLSAIVQRTARFNHGPLLPRRAHEVWSCQAPLSDCTVAWLTALWQVAVGTWHDPLPLTVKCSVLPTYLRGGLRDLFSEIYSQFRRGVDSGPSVFFVWTATSSLLFFFLLFFWGGGREGRHHDRWKLEKGQVTSLLVFKETFPQKMCFVQEGWLFLLQRVEGVNTTASDDDDDELMLNVLRCHLTY